LFRPPTAHIIVRTQTNRTKKGLTQNKYNIHELTEQTNKRNKHNCSIIPFRKGHRDFNTQARFCTQVADVFFVLEADYNTLQDAMKVKVQNETRNDK